MTIRTEVQKFRSAKEAGFRYVGSADVAVVSVVGEKDQPSVPLSAVLHACVERLRPILRGWLGTLTTHRTILFVATPYRSKMGTVARRRGIWADEELGWLLKDGGARASVDLVDANGSRLAGVVEVPDAALAEAADFVRTHRSSTLFASAKAPISEEGVRRMFGVAFPDDESSVNWTSLAMQVAVTGEILLRASGAFDDREVALDALMSVSLMDAITGDAHEST